MATGTRIALVLIGLLASVRATAVPVEGLFEATVAGDSATAARPAAAAEALKQVVVRLTGRRAAASAGGLAPLFANALRYAQTYRIAGAGQVSVGFDSSALEAALLAAGERLWPRDRPATLLIIVSEPAALPAKAPARAEDDARREVERSAQLRGLPLTPLAALDPATREARTADALAGRLEPLRVLAKQLGADGVLVGRLGAGGAAWSWLGSAGAGAFSGPGAEAVELLADRYGSVYASREAATAGRLAVVVRGVRDLGGYAAATQALAGLAAVREVALEEANGETVRFRVAFEGEPAAIRDSAAEAARLGPDPEAPADGALHFVLRP